jgi:hypothetical protein
MRHLRLAAVAMLAIATTATAQRRVNTGGAPAPTKAFEFGVDIGSLTMGLEQPKYLDVALGGQPLVRLAWFLSPHVAFEPRFMWYSRAQEDQVGVSQYVVDFGLLYGFSPMDLNQKPWYARPGVMISGGSGGTQSVTTISGAFGTRRTMKGMLWHTELALNRRLEAGGFPAATYLELRHGLSIRRQ